MNKKNKDVIVGGVGLMMAGGLVDNKAISGVGAGLVVLGVVNSALNTNKHGKKRFCDKGRGW